MMDDLKNLRKEINVDEEKIDNDKVKKEAEKIYSDWQKLEKNWSIFVLHDELDLIETSLVSMKANTEIKSYDMSIEEIDKSIFLLKHIYEKEKLCLKNIF